ncbi:MAG TPA: shikimate kinase [Candidatus Sulfopaludibacter sp.]|jgi:shikimate kinase|nr:shikimate kinase [Candidatus Sulfopaludibacter sp.]
MNLKLKRTPGLYLVGFMGSGKSTIGRALAHRMGWSFFDIDDEIEAAEKVTIAELFDTRGEAEFRRIETEILRQHVKWIERGRPAVLALGGGAFIDSTNRDLVTSNGFVVWLDCPLETVQRRVGHATHRPLARDPEKFAALYHARRETYAIAEIHVPIESDDPAVTVEAIFNHPLFR